MMSEHFSCNAIGKAYIDDSKPSSKRGIYIFDTIINNINSQNQRPLKNKSIMCAMRASVLTCILDLDKFNPCGVHFHVCSLIFPCMPIWHHGGLIAMALYLLPRCTPSVLPSKLSRLMRGTWHFRLGWAMGFWIRGPPMDSQVFACPGIFPTTSDSHRVCVETGWHTMDGKCYGNPQLERSNPIGTNPCVHHMATLNPEIVQHPKMLDPLPTWATPSLRVDL